MQSVGTDGSQVVNYSDRFTLSGMTGSFPPGVKAGIGKVSGTDGPPKTTQEPAAAGGGQEAQGDYAVTYTAQTGFIRYAPMQIPPGTKITLKSVKPPYPTSSGSFDARPERYAKVPQQVERLSGCTNIVIRPAQRFRIMGEYYHLSPV
ncbi:MAG: hypothetical protein Q9196_004426 [Gyalolechia fulgens]